MLDNLNKSNNAIDYYVKKNILINTNILIQKKSLILNDMFFQQPEEIVFRSFIEVIQKIGGQDKYSRGKKVISLLNYLKSKNVEKKNPFWMYYSKNWKINSNFSRKIENIV